MATQSFSFAAEPRAVSSTRRAKYREPGLTSDGRVKRRKAGEKEPSIFDITVATQAYTPVDLTPFLIEHAPEKVMVEVDTQTAAFQIKPPPAPYVPKKTGVDVSTQIEEGELFDFDLEVGPILEVLSSKIIEQAEMEVNEETELNMIRQRRKELDAENERVQQEQRAMEAAEVKAWKEKQAHLEAQRARLGREGEVYTKVSAVRACETMLDGIQDRVMAGLKEKGFLGDPIRDSVINDFLPWMYDAVEQRLAKASTARLLADDLIQGALAEGERQRMAWKCNINITLRVPTASSAEEGGGDEGGDGEEAGETVSRTVGPITVSMSDTVADVQARITEWLREHLEMEWAAYNKTKELVEAAEAGELPEDTEVPELPEQAPTNPAWMDGKQLVVSWKGEDLGAKMSMLETALPDLSALALEARDTPEVAAAKAAAAAAAAAEAAAAEGGEEPAAA